MFRKVPSVNWKDIKPGDYIIDVREASDFKAYNIKGTKNVPGSGLETYKTDKKVFVMCTTGATSQAAVRYLRNKGIDAHNIKGGIMAYE